jgi:hypothetical protein
VDFLSTLACSLVKLYNSLTFAATTPAARRPLSDDAVSCPRRRRRKPSLNPPVSAIMNRLITHLRTAPVVTRR